MVKPSPLFEILEDIEDPRKDINLRHRLHLKQATKLSPAGLPVTCNIQATFLPG